MRKSTSHKPDLARYFRLAVRWAKRAWDLYRFVDLVWSLVEAA